MVALMLKLLYSFYWFLVLTLAYIVLIRPARQSRKHMEPFMGSAIAHRGLWNDERPENSMAAFISAAEHGFGVELDVQMTSDGRLVVFHDTTLDRMCPDAPRGLTIPKCSYEQLQTYCLLGTDQRIPLFCDVLKTLDGTGPLIVEIKPGPRRHQLAAKVRSELAQYFTASPYCIESFDPRILWHLRTTQTRNNRVALGQLSYGAKGLPTDEPRPFRWMLSPLLCNFFSRPDFIAWDHRTTSFAYRLVRRLYRPCHVAWTVRSQQQMDQLRDTYDVQIFEGFIPKR